MSTQFAVTFALDSLVYTVKHLMVSFDGFLVYLPLRRHDPAPFNGKPECIGSCKECDAKHDQHQCGLPLM